MKKKKIGLEIYSKSQVEKFKHMHQELTLFNESLGTDNEKPMPNYSTHEMAELSGYRQMLIAKECEDEEN